MKDVEGRGGQRVLIISRAKERGQFFYSVHMYVKQDANKIL